MTPYLSDADFTLYCGDALTVLRELPDASVDACVTSPPYADARADVVGPSLHDHELIFGELTRVVEGPVLYNVGRIWRGHIEQLWWVDLLRSAQRAGYELLDTIIWGKLNANPIQGELVTNAHEYVLVLGEPGVTRLNEAETRTPYAPSSLTRMRRQFGANAGVKGHDRPLLAEHLVKLASWPGEVVIDPFAGSGTTNIVARKLGRKSIGIELSPEYAALCAKRLGQQSLFADGAAA